jgi:hydrogenase maturation protease
MEARFAMSGPIKNRIVVIGYGSSLRGDDVVGRLVAESVAELHLPNVVAISCTQLVPELAAQIAEARAVIFVDASVGKHNCTVEVHELTCGPDIRSASHIVAAQSLLELATACYYRSPPAWLITVPANEFEMTEQVSPAARQNVIAAVGAVERLLDDLRETEVAHA